MKNDKLLIEKQDELIAHLEKMINNNSFEIIDGNKWQRLESEISELKVIEEEPTLRDELIKFMRYVSDHELYKSIHTYGRIVDLYLNKQE